MGRVTLPEVEERIREFEHEDVVVLRDGMRARLQQFALGSLLLAMSVLSVAIAETLFRLVVSWVGVALFGPLWLQSVVGLVRGGRLEVGRRLFTKVTPLSHRVFDYSRCGPFCVYSAARPSIWGRPRQGRPMVVFDYEGAKGPLGRLNRAFAGFSSFVNASGGLAAPELAELLNKRRDALNASATPWGPRRVLGVWVGAVRVAPDFDDLPAGFGADFGRDDS